MSPFSAIMTEVCVQHSSDLEITYTPRATWWRYQMETFSVLLAICTGNSPVPGEFRSQRPVRRSFDVFFDLRLNKTLSKQSWGWWFETLSPPLWRHCNVTHANQRWTIFSDYFEVMHIFVLSIRACRSMLLICFEFMFNKTVPMLKCLFTSCQPWKVITLCLIYHLYIRNCACMMNDKSHPRFC